MTQQPLALPHHRARLARPLAVLAAAALFGAAASAAETPPTCQALTRADVEALFDRWNDALKTGDPQRVVDNYASDSLLLPTLSNQPRFTAQEKADYFRGFLREGPVGRIDARRIEIDCNAANDTGLYTFTFGRTGNSVAARYSFSYRYENGRWLITSHHSSLMPER